MGGWQWLKTAEAQARWSVVLRIAFKTLILFVGLNVIYAALNPLGSLSQLTLYNSVFPGRERLPYADNPDQAYNVSLARIEGMFASHVITARGGDTERRVLLLGDSGVWGWLLDTGETFSGCLNARDTQLSSQVRYYNLGYPITNVLKDLLILDYAMRYEPDAIVWFTTLEGVYSDDQLAHPILQNNAQRVERLVAEHDLGLDTDQLEEADLFERTIVGQRRELADLIRHQLYGVLWANTGIDHVNPRFFRPPMRNLPASEGVPNRDNLQPGDLERFLAFDIIQAGVDLAQAHDVPLLIVNEPIFISDGVNSDLRYNELYPRWAYDEYRASLQTLASANDWLLLDIWDAVPDDAFTDFPLHYNAEWTCRIAEQVAAEIEPRLQP